MAQINLGHVVGPGVPSGGTAGQVLKKNGSTNYDTSWATLNSGNIPVSESDNTTVQQSLAAVKSDIGIVEDGNTATHTIAAGQYVIWKGALYTASAAIPSGTTLSSSNLTAVSDGGLNALNGNLAFIDNKLTTTQRLIEWTGTSQATVNLTPNPDNYSLLCVVLLNTNGDMVGSITVSPTIASTTTIIIYGESSSQWGSFKLSTNHQQGIFNRTSSNTSAIRVYGVIG